MTVAAILKHKGSEVAGVRPTDTIADVVRVLTTRGIGAVVVRDDTGGLLGILSERDIVHALAAHGAHTLGMTAAALMTRGVTTAAPGTTVAEAMELMTAGRFRHLPVMTDGRMVGLISIGDVVKARISQQEAEVDGLRAYVSGAG
jgi:CBS domain-containing protein